MAETKTVTFDAQVVQLAREHDIADAYVSPECVIAFAKDLLAAAPTPAAQDKGHCMRPACRDGVIHASDCAVHNAPALPTGTCDCGAAPAAQSAGQEAVAWPILKGVGKIDGDGWKDTTKVGQIVYVWNAELPAPYMEGQFPRIGNEIWSASTKQYDFKPATMEEIRDLFVAYAAPVNGGEREHLNVLLERCAERLAEYGMQDCVRSVRGMKIPNDGSPVERAADAQQVDADVMERRTGHEADALVFAIMEEVRKPITAANAYGLKAKANIRAILVDALNRAALSSPAKDAQQKPMTDRQIIDLCKSVGVEWEGPDMCDFMGDFGRVNMAGMRAIINAVKGQK